MLLALLSPAASSLCPCLLTLVEAGEIETRWNEVEKKSGGKDGPACMVVKEDGVGGHKRKNDDESSWELI